MIEFTRFEKGEFKEIANEVRHYMNNPGVLLGLSTGYADLDDRTAGLQKGELTVLGARPGMGKTVMGINIAHNVAERLAGSQAPNEPIDCVVIVSQEMSKPQLIRRWASMLSGVPYKHIRRGWYELHGQRFRLEPHKYEAFTIAMEHVLELPVLFHCRSVSTAEMADAIRRAPQRGYRPRLVVDDYLGLHCDSAGEGNLNYKTAHISRSLKAMTLEFDIPILALHQLNREVDKQSGSKIPELHNLRDSGAVEQDADNVWFIVRPEYYTAPGKGVQPDQRGRMDLYVKKARNEEPNTMVSFRFAHGTTRIEPWEPQQGKPNQAA